MEPANNDMNIIEAFTDSFAVLKNDLKITEQDNLLLY